MGMPVRVRPWAPNIALLAQLGERDTVTVEVRGSKPLRGAKLLSRGGSGHQRGLISHCHPWFKSKPRNHYGSVVEWSMALVLKTSVSKGTVSSNLTASAKLLYK